MIFLNDNTLITDRDASIKENQHDIFNLGVILSRFSSGSRKSQIHMFSGGYVLQTLLNLPNFVGIIFRRYPKVYFYKIHILIFFFYQQSGKQAPVSSLWYTFQSLKESAVALSNPNNHATMYTYIYSLVCMTTPIQTMIHVVCLFVLLTADDQFP
jgi:hypothetical protein